MNKAFAGVDIGVSVELVWGVDLTGNRAAKVD